MYIDKAGQWAFNGKNAKLESLRTSVCYLTERICNLELDIAELLTHLELIRRTIDTPRSSRFIPIYAKKREECSPSSPSQPS